jgi:uncharacterized protein with HEPN domain
MDENIKEYFTHILDCINEIEFFFDHRPKMIVVYKSDLQLKRAVERDLEIIGEAVKRILAANNSIVITDSKYIIGLRNRIAHEYDGLSDEIILSAVINNLPVLKKEVTDILENH